MMEHIQVAHLNEEEEEQPSARSPGALGGDNRHEPPEGASDVNIV